MPSSTIAPPSPNRIAFIDAWRFLAVIMVIQAHILVFSGVEVPILTPYLLPLDRLSELGVLIFFFISGFVICSGLIKEKQQTGKVCLKAFYLRRGIRILPPLWLYLICISVLHQFEITNTSLKQALTSAAFLCNLPIEDECSWFAGHTWTLAYEEQFYLAFPFIFIGVLKSQQVKPLILIMVGLTLSSLLARLNTYAFLADFCMYFLFLLSGCLAALHLKGDINRTAPLPIFVWLFALLSLVFCISYFSIESEKYIKTLLYPALISVLVLYTPLKISAVSCFFNHPTIGYLGRISYTVYLWQELATAYYPNPTLARALIFVLLVFIIAIVSYQYFEKPLAALGSSLSRKIQQQQLS